MNNILLITAQTASDHTGGQGFTLADGMFIPDVFVRTIIIILMFYIASAFLLTLIRMLLNHRLKSKMIQMYLSNEAIEKLLKTGTENQDYAVKWFLLLLFSGIGFAIVSTFPFGWFSIAVITLSLSVGYGGYYIYLKQRKDTH